MKVPRMRMPGADKLLFALAGLALGAGALSWWENRDVVAEEPEPDRVVGVTLFCGGSTRTDTIVYRDEPCLGLTEAGDYGARYNRHYRVSVKSDGFTYDVEYPAIREIEIGDEWPPRDGPSNPYAVKIPARPE